jgi:hypothetical protein
MSSKIKQEYQDARNPTPLTKVAGQLHTVHKELNEKAGKKKT